MRPYPIYLAAAVMTASLLTACGGKTETATETPETETGAKADTTQAGKDSKDTLVADAVTSATNVANSPTFNGVLVVSPNQIATVSSTMGGRIHKLHVMPGKAVGKGQVIATLDDPDFISLQQTYMEASAQLEYLKQEYNRQHALGTKDAASQKKVQQSKAEYLSMRSRAMAAEAQLRALGVNTQPIRNGEIMTYLPVTAPIGGYVTNLTANIGKYVEEGSPICDIINKSSQLLQLTVYEKDLHLMTVGKELAFRVNGMGKKTFSATVISVDQAVDKTDYSIKAYARVKDAHPSFRPGMYVRAKIKGGV
ncbi:MAG: efflux RND transporter periplasmic adaptor subunit [Prevotella sp.]